MKRCKQIFKKKPNVLDEKIYDIVKSKLGRDLYPSEVDFYAAFKPTAPLLTDEEALNAIQNKVMLYPEVFRSINDKQTKTKYVLLSFLVHNPSKNLENISYVKVRDCCDTLDECRNKSIELVKQDSKHIICIAPVGSWCHVTDNPIEVSKENIKIIDNQEISVDHVGNIKKLEDKLQTEFEQKEKAEELELKQRKERLQDPVTPLCSYILTKQKIVDTLSQINFYNKKRDLLLRRLMCLQTLVDKCPEFKDIWFQERLADLNKVNIKSILTEKDFEFNLEELCVSNCNNLCNEQLEKIKDMSTQEVEKECCSITDEFSNLKI